MGAATEARSAKHPAIGVVSSEIRLADCAAGRRLIRSAPRGAVRRGPTRPRGVLGPSILIVASDSNAGPMWHRVLRDRFAAFPLRVVEDLDQAHDAAKRFTSVAVVIDRDRDEDSGTGLLRSMRAAGDETPTLVLSTDVSMSLLAQATELGAGVVQKPLSTDVVLKFLERAVARPRTARCIAMLLAMQARLTPRETDAVEVMLVRETNEAIAEALSVAKSTAAGYVRTVLSKLGYATRIEMLQRVLLVG